MPTQPSLSLPRVGLCTAQARVPLEHVDIRAEIRGAQARVVCTQQYRNGEAQPVEAVYTFPLDEGAAVCGFAAVVGDVRYEGTVKARDDAFAAYDDAMEAGHTAFLLDEERPDVFTASIGNLAPGEEARIELTYVSELAFEGDSIRFTLPTTVSPRYAPAEDHAGIGRPPAAALNPPSARNVPYGLTFTATVTGNRIRRIESPSHPIALDFGGNSATVTLAQEHAALDRDLVLLITPIDAEAPHVALERSTTGRIAAAITFRPTFTTARVPADVVFLVDRSGSMQGSSIEQVRNTLQLCLRSLDAGCAFNIVGFGSVFESLFSECRAYDERSLDEASRYVASLGATLGGTELLPALEFVLESVAQRERALQLVVMTDGQLTNTDAVLDAVRRRGDRVRVFTFGIGRGASQHLVRGLARAGRGAAEFIHPGERIEAKVMRQFSRVFAPALGDVRLDWSGLRAAAIPARIGPVFADEPLRAYAWVDEVASGSVTLHAHGPTGPVSWLLDIRPGDVVDGATVGTLAARARIREIEEGAEWSADRGSRQRDRRDDRAVTEIVRLATEYGLASRETSWIAVEHREVPVTGAVVLRRVPIAVTSGWGGRADDAALTQTGSFDLSTLRADSLADEALILGAPVPRARPMLARSVSHGWLARFRRQRGTGPGHESTAASGAASASARELDRLVALQRADGSWNLDEAMADVIGMPLKELESRLIGATGDTDEIRRAWATALAIAFLTARAAADRGEWELLAKKATNWLGTVRALPPFGTSWLESAANELV
jgi:Ca-activated chloride channel family protein